MAVYNVEVRKLEDKFDGLKLKHIPRRQNKVADKLAKMASERELMSADVFASDQYESSVRFLSMLLFDLGVPKDLIPQAPTTLVVRIDTTSQDSHNFILYGATGDLRYFPSTSPEFEATSRSLLGSST
ncbi:unnamed protein product [Urochloa humidicola]